MKLGLVTDSLADRSLAEAAAVCRGLGLEQVELGCGNWSPAPHVDLKRLTADAGARHRLLDTLGENGLTISALNCSGNPLFPGEKGAGDRAVAEGTFLLADCIYHVHIKDVRLEPAAGQNTLLDTKGVLEFASRSWNFVTPGTGHDAAWWRRFLETLQDCGYDGALSIEQEDYTIPLEEALQKAVSLLRQALPA